MAEAEAPGSLPQRRAGVLRFIPALLSGLAFWWFLGHVGTVAEIGPVGYFWNWVPSLGVSFSFMIDGLALVFALLVSGIGVLVLLYTAEYFRSHPQRNRLLVTLLLFEVSMLGLVTADDILTLFLFWEGTTITSWLLIGFDHEKADARAKAMQALIVTGLGGVALLAGLLMLGAEVGSFRLSVIAASGELIRASDLYIGMFVLVILGCFTKSAQVPFHFWLPNAMAAPTPVSAYLHSATMVKAGVYLLARLSPGLGGTEIWMVTLTGAGAITMLLSSVWAMRQTDLKLGLAFTTVMGLGTLTLMLGVGGTYGIIAFCVFLIVHAFYKAALFLVIGILDKQAGTREADRLGGLGRALPLTYGIALLAALSMAGLPPLFGFIGKEALYEGALHAIIVPGLIALALVMANAMMIAIAGAVGLNPFIGERRAAKAEPRDPSIFMWIGPAVLAFLGLAFGALPGTVDHLLIAPMARAVAGYAIDPHLALFHGLNLALGLSLVTFALGYGLWRGLPLVRARLVEAEQNGLIALVAGARVPVVSGLFRLIGTLWRPGRIPRFETGYDAAVAALDAVGSSGSARLQTGVMTRYLRVTFAVMAAMVLGAVMLSGRTPTVVYSSPPTLAWVAAGMIALGTVVLPFTHRRLLKITALGVVGAGVALVFALFGAIDVAITQLMVETLVVVIIAVALLKLPRIVVQPMPMGVRIGNLFVAGAMGLAFSLGLAAAIEGDLDRSVTAYFEKVSASVAFGRNIVNVILVDFRALDTMGEIAVIAVAGLAALALLAAGGIARVQNQRPEADR